MKQWKYYQISLFTLLCVAVNILGRELSGAWQLPMWMDSFGTMAGAYAGGPFCGGMIGLTGSMARAMLHQESMAYSVVNLALGVTAGFFIKWRGLDNMFEAMTVGALTTFVSTNVSVPLNIRYFGGMTQNLFGDGVIAFLRESGWPDPICLFAGEFYLDFVDKILSVVLLYLILKGFRGWKKRHAGEPEGFEAPNAVRNGMTAVLLAALLAAGAQSVQAAGMAAEEVPETNAVLLSEQAPEIKPVLETEDVPKAQAAPETEDDGWTDYNDYVQTVYSSTTGLPCGEANDIAQTNDGILWIGTYAGLYRYNGREFRWMEEFDSVRTVKCLYADDEGRLWIGTNDNGLSICVNEKIVNVLDQSRGLNTNSVSCIQQGMDGYYYVGTTGSMQVLELNGGLKKVGSLWEVSYAKSITRDEESRIATVTADGRVFLIRRGQILSSLRLPQGGEQFASCAFGTDGKLYVGTSMDHIHVYEISGDWFDEQKVLTCEGVTGITDLHFLENQEILVCADNGIGYLNHRGLFRRIHTKQFHSSIDHILVDYQGNFWFTSSRLGLLRMSRSSFRDAYSIAGMEHKVVNAVAKWKEHYYFGTDSGLDRTDEGLQGRLEDDLTKELEGVRIRCLYTDTGGNLWLCTYGRGLWEAEPDGSIHVFDKENGCINRARTVIQLRDGTIVVGGDGGLCFLKGGEVAGSIGYEPGGIRSMILSVSQLPDGRLLAGTDGSGAAVVEEGKVVRMVTKSDGLSSNVILRTVPDEKGGGVFLVTSNGLCYMDAQDQVRILDRFPYFNNYDIWSKDGEKLFVMSSAGIYVVDRVSLLEGEEELRFDLLDARRGLGSALTANAWTYYDGKRDLFLPCDDGVFVLDTERYNVATRAYRMKMESVLMDGIPKTLDRNFRIRLSRGTTRLEMYPEVINYTIQDPFVGYYLEGYEEEWIIQPQSSLNKIVYTNLPEGKYTLHLAVFDNDRNRILEERTYRIIKEMEIYDHLRFRIYVIGVAMVAVMWLTWFVVRAQVQKTIELQQKQLALTQQQVKMGNETIIAIAKAVDAKDERTSQHSARVAHYAYLIAKEMGLSQVKCEEIFRAGQMHDIGKIGIPDSILNKPSRLTEEEYAVMKSHVVQGSQILKDFTLIDNVKDGVRFHHERYDGRGYPEGLKGEEIPLFGRIIGVADAFDAMTSNRVYRRQMDFDYVLNEMKKGRGTQFDPDADDILLRLIDEGKIDLEALYTAPEIVHDGEEGVH